MYHTSRIVEDNALHAERPRCNDVLHLVVDKHGPQGIQLHRGKHPKVRQRMGLPDTEEGRREYTVEDVGPAGKRHDKLEVGQGDVRERDDGESPVGRRTELANERDELLVDPDRLPDLPECRLQCGRRDRELDGGTAAAFGLCDVAQVVLDPDVRAAECLEGAERDRRLGRR